MAGPEVTPMQLQQVTASSQVVGVVLLAGMYTLATVLLCEVCMLGLFISVCKYLYH